MLVNGHTYLKIDGSDYSQTDGYGWYSPPEAHWMTNWLGSGPNVLQRSVLYSDWGRPATFEFDLPNGAYDVTVSVGWLGRTYAHHKVEIEGVSFVDDEATTPATPYLVRTKRLSITDNKLTAAVGIFDEYTMLNYIDVEAANPPVHDLWVTQAVAGTDSLTVTLQWKPPTSALTTTLRYASASITAANWDSAATLAAGLPGRQKSYSADVPYSSGILYFALKTQNGQNEWSPLSNNAFWPSFDIYLLTMRR